MINNTIDTQVYTVQDIASILKIGKNTAYNLVKSKEFPVLKFGDTYRISKEVFESWLHRQ